MFRAKKLAFSPDWRSFKAVQPNPDFVATLEQSTLLSLAEKIDLLAMFLGYKLTTEVFEKIEWSTADELECPLPESIKNLEEVLARLGLPFFIDSLEKTNRQTGRRRRFTWFQVSINRNVSQYMEKNKGKLSNIDYGVLYGYPTTAIQAFCGFLPAALETPRTVGGYLLGGTFSQPFREQETAHFDRLWQLIVKISPKIASEAAAYFEGLKVTPSRGDFYQGYTL